MSTRIKICGITNLDDLDAAIAAGADSVGFNMYRGSPRYVDIETAKKLVSAVPDHVTAVGLFINEDRAGPIAGEVGFDLLQFSGDESDEQCQAASKPYMKGLRLTKGSEALSMAERYPGATALLLDARLDGAYGGTGRTFEWTGIGDLGRPFYLAGGLTPDNVGEAIHRVRPFAVDVASGVESEPGKKDARRIDMFVAAVRQADEELTESASE